MRTVGRFHNKCYLCGKDFQTHKKSQKFCDQQCRKDYVGMDILPTWSNLRMAVLARDRFHCFYCGRGPDDGAKLEVDHVIPRAQGGEDRADNLVACCRECNASKSDKLFATEINELLINRIFKKNKKRNHAKESQ